MTDNTETINKIAKQVEYYFSDSNYARDKFLLAEAAKNPDKYIGIDVIASFNRMKSISTDLELITETLKKSEKLQVSEDGKMVKRVDPLPESEDSTKTLYSKGWPKEDTTIEKVEEFFKPYGKVLSVRFRKDKEKNFKGSLFVDFESAEIVTKIITETPKLAEDKPLEYLTFDQFSEEKKAEKEKYTQSRKRKTMDGESGANPDTNKTNKKEQKKEEKVEQKPIEMVPGCIIAFTDMGATFRPDLSTYFSTFGDVSFVGYSQGDSKGNVRYSTPADASSALEKLQAEKKEIGGKVPTYALLEGDDEKSEWDIIIKKHSDSMNNTHNSRGGKRGRGRGRGRGRK